MRSGKAMGAPGLIFLAVLITVSMPNLSYAAGDKALGEYLSGECVTCHQVAGQDKGIPAIVGLPEAAFIGMMEEYKQKKRANPLMQNVAARLSQDDIAALATYFGSLPRQPRSK